MNEYDEDIENKLRLLKIKMPNVGKLWETYLKVKKESYIKSLIEFEEMLKKHEGSDDLKMDAIITLYFLNMQL
tara:strand:+ start:1850 stop:2068 length:219 start_codon:yes stop_codon:yes gene_type:complete